MGTSKLGDRGGEGRGGEEDVTVEAKMKSRGKREAERGKCLLRCFDRKEGRITQNAPSEKSFSSEVQQCFVTDLYELFEMDELCCAGAHKYMTNRRYH